MLQVTHVQLMTPLLIVVKTMTKTYVLQIKIAQMEYIYN